MRMKDDDDDAEIHDDYWKMILIQSYYSIYFPGINLFFIVSNRNKKFHYFEKQKATFIFDFFNPFHWIKIIID